MARLRTIKPDFFLDEELSGVSIEAHFLLAGLWTIADREGRLEDRPRRIQVQVFPYRQVNVDACLDELHQAHRVIRYSVEGKPLLQIVDWARDQRPHIREAPSHLPPPPQLCTEHQPSTDPAPATSRRLPGEITAEPAGIRDQGSEIGDLRSRSSESPSAPPAARAGGSGPSQGSLVEVPSQRRTTQAQEFVLWARAQSRPRLAPDAPDNCVLQNGQWPRLGQALKAHGLLKLQAAFSLYLADRYALEEGLPLGLFVGQWEKWVGRVTAPAAENTKQSRAPASGSHWTEDDLHG